MISPEHLYQIEQAAERGTERAVQKVMDAWLGRMPRKGFSPSEEEIARVTSEHPLPWSVGSGVNEHLVDPLVGFISIDDRNGQEIFRLLEHSQPISSAGYDSLFLLAHFIVKSVNTL